MMKKKSVTFISALLICSCNASGVQEPQKRADAIVVLAGSYTERIPAAAAIFHNGQATVIILANDGVRDGWSEKYQRNLYHIEFAEELLIESGVPRKKIVSLPYYGSGTIYDAMAVERFLLTHNVGRRLLLVTSAYHVRRTQWTFRRILAAMPIELDVYPVKSDGSELISAVLENSKLLYYKVRFGLLGLLPELEKNE